MHPKHWQSSTRRVTAAVSDDDEAGARGSRSDCDDAKTLEQLRHGSRAHPKSVPSKSHSHHSRTASHADNDDGLACPRGLACPANKTMTAFDPLRDAPGHRRHFRPPPASLVMLHCDTPPYIKSCTIARLLGILGYHVLDEKVGRVRTLSAAQVAQRRSRFARETGGRRLNRVADARIIVANRGSQRN